MAEVQKSLERYDVLHRIAVGGMAEVFLAKAYGAHGFEKTLAIKRILPELARDPEFEERFIAEAKVAVKLSHTNVVQVFDFGRFAGSLFIAMEFVDGIDLAAMLRRHRETQKLVSIPAAFQIAIEIARGLDFAHMHGVVHRDVSPSNILLSRAGEVKIADFGIAVAAQPRETIAGVRRIMGKWRYMSPEQTRGEELDTRSDLFSAASVMFELFTGEKLFPGDDSDEIIRNIRDMALPRPSQIRSGLPTRLDEILHAALARKPGDRPVRAAVMQRALTELSYESSIVATALDVAEAVNAVVDERKSRGTSLDDLIRKQIASALGGERTDSRFSTIEVSRHTSVQTDPEAGLVGNVTEPSPGRASSPTATTHDPFESAMSSIEETGRVTLIQSIDDDGVSVLEVSTDKVPDDLEMPAARARSKDGTTATGKVAPAPPSRRRWVGVAGVVALAAAGGTVWLVRALAPAPQAAASREPPVVAPPPPPVTTGVLELDSVPPGAHGTVDGKPVGATPARLEVTAGRPLVVNLQLAGYQTYVDDRVIVDPGRTVRLRAVLAAARAGLRVLSEPAGATVLLDGRAVGETPTTVDDLDPGIAVEVTLVRGGFERATATVELRGGEIAELMRVLKPVPRFGAIDLYIDEGWAEVYLHGKRIGRAPAKGLRLPVGKHRLRLVNPPSGKETQLDVVVDEREVRYYRTKL